jgi:hypothetical protein
MREIDSVSETLCLEKNSGPWTVPGMVAVTHCSNFALNDFIRIVWIHEKNYRYRSELHLYF